MIGSKEIGLSGSSSQSCTQNGLVDGIFWADEDKQKIQSPKNIVGYYLRMVKSFFDDENTSVAPSLQNEFSKDFGDPVITVRRGAVSPRSIGIIGDKKPLSESMPLPIPNFDTENVSLEDSKMYSDMLDMGISINIYANSDPEVERIAHKAYQLIMATSYDALRNPFPFIISVSPPSLSPVDTMEKHDYLYTCSIQWSVTYRDDTVLLIRKNVIKYAKITVQDEPIENIILKN